MAPFRGARNYRGATRSRVVPGGRGGSRGSTRGRSAKRFTTARVEQQDEDDSDSPRPEALVNDVSSQDEDEEEEPISDEDEKPVQKERAYNVLLQAFQLSRPAKEPQRKKRKVENQDVHLHQNVENGDNEVEELEELEAAVGDDGPMDDDGQEELVEPDAFDDAEGDTTEPFEAHFANPDDNELAQRLKAIQIGSWQTQKVAFGNIGQATFIVPGATFTKPTLKPVRKVEDMVLKKRLTTPAKTRLPALSDLQQAVAPPLFNYQDMLLGCRTVGNAEELRKLYSLHVLNHVFRAKDRVQKNNYRLGKQAVGEDLECRDQSFARPKVLLLLETRQACARALKTLVSLGGFEQEDNKSRFQEYFVQPEDKYNDDRPEDFRELFEGNDDNEYRIGVHFNKKSIKYFSPFYRSDIILASPLGMRRAIEGKNKKDYDFLSSIEILIMDQMDAMLFQNVEHIQYVLDHLNLQPKADHGVDFTRVRTFYLDGQAKNFRQTIAISAYLTPELNSLASKHMQNWAGRLRYAPENEGAITDIGLQVKQTFSRFQSQNPADDPDARFKYFTTAIIPSLTRYPKPAEGGQGIIIFIPSYLDFVRIRNYFAGSPATQNISFGAVSEYNDVNETRSARSHFLKGHYSVLLYSGRAHHFRRYEIKGAKRVFFYALPDNPIFYKELVGGFLGTSIAAGKLDQADAVVKVLFSKWDGLKLERVVGTRRVGNMLKEKSGDTFDFV